MEWALVRRCIVMSIFIVAASASSFPAASSSPACRRGFRTFLRDLNLQCPLSVPSSASPVLVDGTSFEETFISMEKDGYVAILFYSSQCPFSRIMKCQFSTLSSQYPQIKHLMVEQSSTMPSVFSRYGVHSVPSLVMVHQTSRMRYHGQKHLHSIVEFYQKTTGLKPLLDTLEAEPCSLECNSNGLWPWNGVPLKEAFSEEPYLLLSVVFVLSRAFLYFFPGIISCLKALWISYIPLLNLGIFGDSRQLLARVLHLTDVKRIWSKLNLTKTRNFHRGARNARVWASSLASVSLGKTSSSSL